MNFNSNNPATYQVQQSSFQSPPVLYSQSQPMMVSNQNNMNYQLVNLGAGAIMAKMQERQKEETIIDMLTKQNEIVRNLVQEFNTQMIEEQQELEDLVYKLEKDQIILKQQLAEQRYIYKLNRQMSLGLEKIREQQMKQIVFPRAPAFLQMKMPRIKEKQQEQDIPQRRVLRVAPLDPQFSRPNSMNEIQDVRMTQRSNLYTRNGE